MPKYKVGDILMTQYNWNRLYRITKITEKQYKVFSVTEDNLQAQPPNNGRWNGESTIRRAEAEYRSYVLYTPERAAILRELDENINRANAAKNTAFNDFRADDAKFLA